MFYGIGSSKKDGPKLELNLGREMDPIFKKSNRNAINESMISGKNNFWWVY